MPRSAVGAQAGESIEDDVADGPVRVLVAEGVYPLTEPLLLGPEDGGTTEARVTYEAAIMADGIRHVTIEDCEISHVGLYGVWFRHGCQDSRVERCLIEDLGAGRVRIGETAIPGRAAETGGITVADTIIRGGGRIFPCAVGLWIGQSGDNQILHNDVGDLLYTGLSVGWRWGYDQSLAKRNLIAFNHVHHIGQGVLSDLGGIYTLGPTLEEWQASGHDQGSILADPMFIDPKAGDFRLRPDSPALQVGFIPFDPSEAGVRGSRAWRQRARDYPWPALQLPPPPHQP